MELSFTSVFSEETAKTHPQTKKADRKQIITDDRKKPKQEANVNLRNCFMHSNY